jgi:hypothetical protein
VTLEGLGQFKNLVTSSGLEAATLNLVTFCRNLNVLTVTNEDVSFRRTEEYL